MLVFRALPFRLPRLILTFATNPSQFYRRLVRTLQTIYAVYNDAGRPTGKDMRMHWFFYTPQDGLTCFYYNGVGSFALAKVAQCSKLIDIQGLAIHVPKYTTKNTACNDRYLTLISRWRLTNENETMLAGKHQQINCNTCYILQEVDRMASS
jgi:hypothetical protein